VFDAAGDLQDGNAQLAPACSLAEHDNIVSSVSVNPAGGALASGSWDSLVKLWDLAQPDSGSTATLAGHGGFVWGVDWNTSSPHLLASASQDGTVRTWDARAPSSPGGAAARGAVGMGTAGAGAAATATLRSGFPALCVSWSQHSAHLLAAGFEDGTVKWYDVRNAGSGSGALLAEYTGHEGCVHTVRCSPRDEHTVVTGSDDASVHVLSVDAGGAVRAASAGAGAGAGVAGNAGDADGDSIFTAADGAGSAGGAGVAGGAAAAELVQHAVLRSHKDYVRGVAWSMDDPQWLGTVSWDGSMRTMKLFQ
jgi:WD40 repeat protein